MTEFEKFQGIISKLRAPDGCPWDREQTHASLKKACIEEAVELIAGIDMYEKTGNAENMQEELGDLLLQVVMHATIAEEEGLFTMDDVCRTVSEKMIRRHPHIFGDAKAETSEEVLKNWDAIKAQEKNGKEPVEQFLSDAFNEAEEMIDIARKRKNL
ncbi:MAG: MazG family protein [Lachnospiraceae bacterium]|nr:MazG family protein [Lachnospiraceae bacterium]